MGGGAWIRRAGDGSRTRVSCLEGRGTGHCATPAARDEILAFECRREPSERGIRTSGLLPKPTNPTRLVRFGEYGQVSEGVPPTEVGLEKATKEEKIELR